MAPDSSLCQLNRHMDSCLQGIGRFLAPKNACRQSVEATGTTDDTQAFDQTSRKDDAGGSEKVEGEIIGVDEAADIEDMTESELIVACSQQSITFSSQDGRAEAANRDEGAGFSTDAGSNGCRVDLPHPSDVMHDSDDTAEVAALAVGGRDAKTGDITLGHTGATSTGSVGAASAHQSRATLKSTATTRVCPLCGLSTLASVPSAHG
eukprot:SAG31_NODE_4234_length_3433_cov_2.113677_2_plen_207_part_00